MSALFDTLYADTGRTSIAPEKLMRAQLLQLLYSLRSERMCASRSPSGSSSRASRSGDNRCQRSDRKSVV